MTRARNLAGLGTVTAQPTVTTPVHLGPLGVVTATRYYGTFDETNIISTSIATTDIQISGITTGLNVSGIITAQNGLDVTGNIVNGLNVSAGIATLQALTATTGTFTGNVSIAGTLTYEDITDIDSVGVGTFRKGIIVAGLSTFNSGLNVTGNIVNGLNVSAGIATFQALQGTTGTFSGDVDIADKIVHTGDTNTAIRFPSADTFSVETAGSERIRVDSNGKLLVGKNSVYGSAIAQVHNTSQYVLDLNLWSADANAAVLAFYKSRNATPGGATIVQDDDGIGSLRFLGNDGANSREGAYIKAFVDGTPGTNDMPGRLVFGTTADGASGSTERCRIDSSGRLLVGHTASEAMFFTGSIQVQGTTSSTSAITVKTNQNDSGGPAIILGKSRGAKGSATVVQDGDELGAIHFAGADGTDTNSRAGAIRCNVDGTPGSNDMPGRLVFLTTADGASTETERLRISADGAIKFSGASYNMTWRYAASALRLDDNTQLNFGTGDDGDIYHDGSQMIVNNGTGTLKVRSNNLQLTRTDNEVHINCASGAQVDLYYSGNKKLETTSAGITVTGTIDDTKGDVRDIPNVSKTSAYTLVATDGGKAIHITTGGITVPNAIFAGGEAVTIVNSSNSDQTITQGSSLTMYLGGDAGTTGNRTLAGRGVATVWFHNGSTAYISGSGLS